MTARHSSPAQSRPAWSCWGRGIAAIPLDPSCVGWTMAGVPVRVLDDGTIAAGGLTLGRTCGSRAPAVRQCSGERDACGAEDAPIVLFLRDKPARPQVYDLARALCSAIAAASSDLRARVVDWREYDCATIEVRHVTARGRAAFNLHEYRRGIAWIDGWTEAPLAVHEIVRVALAAAQKHQAGG